MSYWKPPETYKRALSPTRAAACEAAARKTCICRCGGALHGKSHAAFIDATKAAIAEHGELSRDAHVEMAVERAETPRDRKNRLRREARAAKLVPTAATAARA
ncbi:hypothetical protein LCGC14_0446350 [marine sediment metagenome]|uniref:Uncharacterized protein n=1 Tax=marine sediment metagenome TaxID=412755 RepID=A0A0F9SJ12_9ZZZZ